jgi:integrase
MARTAKAYPLHSKTSRMALDPRPKPYYTQIRPGLTLGYIRRESGAGSWQLRMLEAGVYRFRTLGNADDIERADGRDVLSYSQALAAIASPTVSAAPVGRLTVARAMESYLQALAARSKHAKGARQTADYHILPKLGAIRVDRLTKTELEEWRDSLVRQDGDAEDKRRSQDTANRIMTVLWAALNHAFADDANGIPSDGAWRKCKRFRKVERPRTDHFSAVQVRQLVASAAIEDRAFATLIEAAFITGARLGELINANVGDLRGATLQVDGKTGRRTITLSAEGAALFKRQATGRDASLPLLPRTDGKRWGVNDQQHRFDRAAARAGLPESACFYILRHSHISRAIEAGMPLTIIAANTGTSVRMIEKNYAHVLQETRREIVEATSPKLRRVK